MDTKTLSTSRYNSTNSQLFSVEYLVVAGGGGSSFGGGGAGGVVYHSSLSASTNNYAVVVGGGGTGIENGSDMWTSCIWCECTVLI